MAGLFGRVDNFNNSPTNFYGRVDNFNNQPTEFFGGVDNWLANGGGFVLSDVFATTLYTGSGVNQDIISDLDFIAKDGLVWIKDRDAANSHNLYDTIRGVQNKLFSNAATAESATGGLDVFNNDGFNVDGTAQVGASGRNYVSWQWIVAAGFFDILKVTKTTSVQVFNHSLGSPVGLVDVKSLAAGDWYVWHKDLTADEYLLLNENDAKIAVNVNRWDSTAPSSTQITLGSDFPNGDYAIYMYAHNPDKGIFCGSYSGTGAAGNKIVTGFPVGLLLIKNTSIPADWLMFDIKRGMVTGTDGLLEPNTSDTEATGTNYVDSESDGFTLQVAGGDSSNQSGDTYIFMAIADPDLF